MLSWSLFDARCIWKRRHQSESIWLLQKDAHFASKRFRDLEMLYKAFIILFIANEIYHEVDFTIVDKLHSMSLWSFSRSSSFSSSCCAWFWKSINLYSYHDQDDINIQLTRHNFSLDFSQSRLTLASLCRKSRMIKKKTNQILYADFAIHSKNIENLLHSELTMFASMTIQVTRNVLRKFNARSRFETSIELIIARAIREIFQHRQSCFK